MTMRKDAIKAGMRITGSVLVKLGACKIERRDFEEKFPKGLILNTQNLNRAEEARLDTSWLMNRCLYERERNQLLPSADPRWKTVNHYGYEHASFIRLLKARE